MRNVNVTNKYKASHTPVSDRIASYMHAGWSDFRSGAGFAEAYDTWSQADQINYEIGRRMAAVAAAGGKIPAWASNHKCPVRRVSSITMPAWSAEIAYDRLSHVAA